MKILEQTLCHLNGISPSSEISLRRQGFWSAQQLIIYANNLFTPSHAERLRSSFERWTVAKKLGLVDILVNSLPVGHRVRALADYYEEALFLDIETTGLQRNALVTCIATFQAGKAKSFVRGKNFNDFLYEWTRAKIVVTFNGKRFDIPLLQREFNFTTLPAQIDLMDEARHYGYKGGLKSIEHQINFQRDNNDCSNGLTAIQLWENYQKNNDATALQTLLQYNTDDTRCLTKLWQILLKKSLENTGIRIPQRCLPFNF